MSRGLSWVDRQAIKAKLRDLTIKSLIDQRDRIVEIIRKSENQEILEIREIRAILEIEEIG